MKKYILVFLNIFLLISCYSSHNKKDEHVYVVNLNEAVKEDFYSVFDSITYISLETVEDNEIGEISRILYHNSKYIVVDRVTNIVFIFKDDGEYYSKIEAIGNGPGEYVQITDIAINKFDEIVKILDAMQGKIISYDLNGRFIGETMLPVFPSPLHFCQVDKEMYAFDFQRCSSEKEWRYNLCINVEDFSGNVNKFLPYNKPLDICFSPRITLQNVNGEIIYIYHCIALLYILLTL